MVIPSWDAAKSALVRRLLCIRQPRTVGDAPPPTVVDPSASSAVPEAAAEDQALMTQASSGQRLSKSGNLSSKKTCAICLGSMKPGHGHALFTAECSHTFHFNCIASNVKHGNQVCPVCRAKWKEIPFGGPLSSELPHGRARVNPVNWPQDDDGDDDDDDYTTISQLPRSNTSNRQYDSPLPFNNSEPNVFDDDEPLDLQGETSRNSEQGCDVTVDIETHLEISAIQQSASQENFAVLIHLQAYSVSSRSPRAPVDLVAVLDVSGSMSGTNLALLKQAMGFVIQNLGPSDRLSVVCFSSTARRLFQLRRMSEAGREQALLAINSLRAGGGTNIAEGLRIGAKVMEERKEKNPVCSIIFLSDGQDTYTTTSAADGVNRQQPNYQSLVPPSILGGSDRQIPVPLHAFGFGADHDSASMHYISETSGGTFSFVEAEDMIQDAFAQCIGGLLSVVVQEMQVGLECMHDGVCLGGINSGSYPNRLLDDGRMGSIFVGNLYADEERKFLVHVDVPPTKQEDMLLLKVDCVYRDPVSKEMISLETEEVRVQRPEVLVSPTLSIEVDCEKNRIETASAMAEARAAADCGRLSQAVSILEERRRMLSESLAGRSDEQLCVALDAELREMQERMNSWQSYQNSGRAYVLSGMSSHSWQRATARGNSTDITSLVRAYQTPSMVDMLNRSQVFNLSPHSQDASRPARLFRTELHPR